MRCRLRLLPVDFNVTPSILAGKLRWNITLLINYGSNRHHRRKHLSTFFLLVENLHKIPILILQYLRVECLLFFGELFSFIVHWRNQALFHSCVFLWRCNCFSNWRRTTSAKGKLGWHLIYDLLSASSMGCFWLWLLVLVVGKVFVVADFWYVFEFEDFAVVAHFWAFLRGLVSNFTIFDWRLALFVGDCFIGFQITWKLLRFILLFHSNCLPGARTWQKLWSSLFCFFILELLP